MEPYELDEESRRELLKELRMRYFLPQVSRIVQVRQHHDVWIWQLETDAGPMRMIMPNLHEHVQAHGVSRLILTDVNGRRAEIRDLQALDGALYHVDAKGTLPKPFLLMEAEDFMARRRQIEQMNETITDEELKKMYLTREMLHGLKKHYSLIDRVSQQGATLVYLEGAAHYNFTYFPLFSDLLRYTGMAGSMKGARGIDIIHQYVLDFFNKHLKGTGGKLLQGPSAEYPEVKFPYLSAPLKPSGGQ
ncbi:DUF1854 domain-containing protein [Paenibacillus melissococcoides]|uniref:DUF1854 domain-containing protein n=1 Tax=Paenibacillus melissococcoides TaxID=2912268 RepID=A0ABM9FYG1_9BACL|nr:MULTISPECIES: DUF1854 domain-containing protein [Paenibacillus]MEB9895355.1 DUF1854 domain-containing protein [Bacillus cereus]CAH8244279.1 DUF1854 domain-containing protein [Paenibacillus melissococcoides]CAH8703519.1 DUF1854 domain-containing protein [Paenibacillus melissococcoides]CAH8705936.1 DUF1854 domain-containing protein [Paenibacillus melissococcoides]GIO81539.1 hypothetical protein J6TS7_51490 [Paenibacillus dendritiformis]